MKKFRSTNVSVKPSAAPAARPAAGLAGGSDVALQPRGGLLGAWERFWFNPADPIGLHALRVLAGLLFLVWLLTLAGHEEALYGLSGWLDREFYIGAAQMNADSRQANMPISQVPMPIGWSALYLAGTDASLLRAMYWASIAILALFTVGIFPRITAVLAWVVVASFTSNPAMAYDGDALLQVLAFYLMIGYLGYGLLRPGVSVLGRIVGPRDALLLGGQPGREGPAPSAAANVTLRLLQIHFAMAVVASAFHKLQFGEWWSGAALWYPLYPPYGTTFAEAHAHAAHASFYLSVLSLAAYAMLAWQFGFPFFAWNPRWRVVLLGGAALGWLGTALAYGMPVFGPAYFLGCLAFLTPAEWRKVLSWLPNVPGVARAEGRATAGAAGKREAVALAAGRAQ